MSKSVLIVNHRFGPSAVVPNNEKKEEVKVFSKPQREILLKIKREEDSINEEKEEDDTTTTTTKTKTIKTKTKRGYKRNVSFKSDSTLEDMIPHVVASYKEEDEWSNVSYFIRYWNLDFIEANNLTKFRDKLLTDKDVRDHPLTKRPSVLIRFLKAQRGAVNFRIKKAELMFCSMIQWRIEQRLELKNALTMNDDDVYVPPRYLLEQYPGAILQNGGDKDGDPIYISRLGYFDAILKNNSKKKKKKLKKSIKFNSNKSNDDNNDDDDKLKLLELENYETFRRESIVSNSLWLKEWTVREKRPLRQILVIEDLQGLSKKPRCDIFRRIYGATKRWDLERYPEMVKKIILIRVPYHFMALWNIRYKRCIPKSIRDKIVLVSDKNYLELLQKDYIDDLQILPPFMNGKGIPVDGMSPLTSFL
eukprot:CAMPEP_0194141826 /NCGR_PEP_ID=MMETSP0152-20130528/11200_1 /TAXON_ID=1049557 /ORGANISM="Thalassiothrix antarctica, Strain L6-D1" /LENGTH=418 /DNA_ID=CAMNT_0038840583 /DNA_START=135 /DNA_END=1391 /DNA_ORIENTATION=-